MPSTYEPIVVDGLDDAEQDDLNKMLAQLQGHKRRNLLRASYYDGKRAIKQVGTVIPPIYYRLAIVLGWSAKAVDILARRCNLDGFVWPDGTLADEGADDVIEANHLTAELSAAMVSALIHGVAFLINTAGVDDEPKSLVHVKDAMNGTGLWNSRRRRLDAFVSVTGRDAKGRMNAGALYKPDETVEFVLDDDGRWSVDGRLEHRLGMPVEPLVYKPRPGRPFGSSRISRAVMSTHDMALRTLVRMEAHADVYSFPDMWMLGADESIFTNADGSQKAAWQIVLGRIKGIPDATTGENTRADVKQFPAASPEPHVLQLKTLARLFAGETSIPEASLGLGDLANPTSAESYIASREELIAEAEGATDDWSPAIRRMFVRALAIQTGKNEIPDGYKSIVPKWRSPVHLSRSATADAGAKIIAVAPWLLETEVGLELLGLDKPQIDRAMADRRRNQGRDLVRQLLPQPPAVADGAVT